MKLKRKFIFDSICNPCVEPNNGKILDIKMSRGSYSAYIRDRKADTKYFKIIVRGNYIRAIQYRYLDENGEGQNLFHLKISVLVTEKKLPKPVQEKKLLLKVPLEKYKEFPAMFKEETPSLWWEEDHKEEMLEWEKEWEKVNENT